MFIVKAYYGTILYYACAGPEGRNNSSRVLLRARAGRPMSVVPLKLDTWQCARKGRPP